jgi:hypothetical protein
MAYHDHTPAQRKRIKARLRAAALRKKKKKKKK